MTKKVLAIFLVILMALSFSACVAEKNSNKSSNPNEWYTGDSSWDTISDLSDRLFINGTQIFLPCSIKSLKEAGVKIDPRKKWSYNNDEILKIEYVEIYLYCNNKAIGVIQYDNRAVDEVTDDTMCNSITLFCNILRESKNDFNFNGITKASNKTDVEAKLGEFYHPPTGGYKLMDGCSRTEPGIGDNYIIPGYNREDLMVLLILNIN